MHAVSLVVTAFTASCAAGSGRAALLEALRARRTGLAANDFTEAPLDTFIGRVRCIEDQALPPALAEWECRNNRLAWHGLQSDGFLDAVEAARERYGASRVAIVLGTSTSSIGATEEGYRRLGPDGQYPEELRRPIVHTVHSLGYFVQRALRLNGVCVTVATACSSSAKVFAQAERLIRLGVADAAVVGGVDTLCYSVLFGFNALELVSPEPCRPFDPARRGISLGEAAGFALLEREGARAAAARLRRIERCTPHVLAASGRSRCAARHCGRAGARWCRAQRHRLHQPARHGQSEERRSRSAHRGGAVSRPHTRASSTKGWTGHALGAAGILEATITLLALESGFMPGTLNSRELDSACGPQIRLENGEGEVRYALSHSFGFGGSNCVLLFGQAQLQ